MNKKNPEVSKQFLERALKELPQEAGSARFHIKQAINEIVKIETKTAKKQQGPTPLQNWKLNLETGTMVHPTEQVTQRALGNLEAMIAREQAKIDNIRQPKSQPAVGNINLLNGNIF